MSESTSFVQWRERARSEIREERPHVRWLLVVAAIVVMVGILAGVIAFLLG
ncbi:hypothetical protein DFQ14_107128 [Halopolyspora algeriensis]|uniref:Uncharacterized protein n=1 Tax=Halopolyspora algeriensis TaxID=1500506 RepID=A0A368VNE0_9ACTN|nr:hypothetical protein [Halopolyspora algeriensis]RCW43239.1 hypothetical protein DFQ14_107128 [Halopolyspora algeriensis]TQM56298.1 hypothetical protein FHU43_1092 [Halopolyspora algeriensis]